MEKGQYETAIEEFQRVLVKDPKNWETYAYMGDVYRMLGNNDEAILYYNDSIYHNPEGVESYEGLAIAYADKGIKFDEAVDLLNKTQYILKDDKFALEATKDSYLESLGWVYYKKGDIAKALTFYNEAYPIWQKGLKIGADEFNPYFAETHYHFGVVFLHKNEPDKAREEFEKAIKCSPNSIFAKRAREELANIKPSLATPLEQQLESIEAYSPERAKKQTKKRFYNLLLETLAILAYFAFLVAWFGYELFPENIQRFYDYLEAHHPLLVALIGTFLSGIFLFWRIKKAIRQKDIGVFQSVLLVICSVVFILFLIILTVVIIHMINNIPL